VTEIGSGWYKVAGHATDAGTLGPLLLHATGTGADPCDDRFEVVSYNPEDANAFGLGYLSGDAFARLGAPAGASVSADVAAVKTDTAAVKTKTDFLPSATAGAAGGVFIAGTNAPTTITTALTTTFTGNLSGSVGSIATGGIAAGSFAAGAIDAAAIAADAIGSSELAASAVTEIVSAIWQDTTAGDFTVASSIGKTIVNGVALGTGLTINAYTGDTPQTGDTFARIGATGSGLTSLASQASVNTIDDFVDTEVAAILAAVDTEVGAIKTVTDQLTFGTANRVNAQVYGMEANTVTAAALAADAVDEILDDTIGDSTVTVRQALKLMVAALGGRLSGAATTTVTIRNVANTTNVITATVDADGNRSDVTLSL
jgi:hypothetical protein